MRLRHIPGSEEFVRRASATVNEPERYRGKWSAFFREDAPLALEIGMGKGRFLRELSAREPGWNFLGLERYASVLQKAIERKEREEREQGKKERENLFFLWEDAKRLTEIFAPGEVARIYLNFSDPWPKAGHAMRRLTSREFLKLYDAVLAPEGEIWFKTDNDGLFAWSLEEIPAAGWTLESVTRDLHGEVASEDNVMTEYEQKFSSRGQKISRLIATRKKLARLQDQVGQSEIIPPANCSERTFGGAD